MDVGKILGTFIHWPILALLPAVALAGMYYRRRRNIVLATSLLWLVYVAYEQAMKLRILCSGECNIRIDLLIIYPLLLVMTLLSVFIFVKAQPGK